MISAVLVLLLASGGYALGQGFGLWNKPHQPSTSRPPVTSQQPVASQQPVTSLHRTPRLGLQFWQDGQEAAMSFLNLNVQIIQVSLTRAPFEMWFPAVNPGTAVQVCAWTDDSIFSLQADSDVTKSGFFSPGTGIADDPYGSGTLFLNNEGNNYLIGTRIEPAPNGMGKFFISTIWPKGQTQGIPISQSVGELDLTIFIDHNGNGRAEIDDYEYVLLSFK
jgi:hypothetical protein